eukprot:4677317-Amphidinium_carterae.1
MQELIGPGDSSTLLLGTLGVCMEYAARYLEGYGIPLSSTTQVQDKITKHENILFTRTHLCTGCQSLLDCEFKSHLHSFYGLQES